jgi:hypothetical protein
LNRYISSLFGLKDVKNFRDTLKDKEEGISQNNQFFFTENLKTLPILEKLRQELNLYDENIQEYLQKINVKRNPPIKLKYFQYLAILFTEIYLDSFFNDFDNFYEDLSQFISLLSNKEKKTYHYPAKTRLNKLCFWSATGSGKTLIMHFNILQVLKYFKGNFDNLLLVTPPSESLSSQHIDELVLSDIKNKKFDRKRSDLTEYFTDIYVKVIEISKIKEEVTSKDGLSVPVEAFGENNLVFVDEGHKGHSSEAKVWKGLREKLVGKEGFTFEYSATFGEISDRDDTFNEYASSIIFDYRYKFFYEDGYGKDYSILNLKNAEDYGDEYFTGSLLSLYEQKLYFLNHELQTKEFNIYHPLMIFVGTSVSGKKNRSDVFFICKFFSQFIKNKDKFKRIIQDIFSDNSSLLDLNEQPVFQNKFHYLRNLIGNNQLQISDIYDQMHKILFHSTTSSKIRFIDIKKADGEVGLKLGSEYFGLINIGDVSTFLKLIEKEEEFIIGQQEHFEESLFKRIDSEKSSVNFLIGSKKFIEGWNSYRVSSMGLLNIGKKQGTQIVQLFGRGVRLKGYKNLLKRSYAIKLDPNNNFEGNIPEYFTLLETLNIFGLNADYMAVFRENLKEEGIEEYEKYILSIKPNVPNRALYLPQIFKNLGIFLNEVQITSLIHPISDVQIDLSSKVELLDSLKNNSLSVLASPLQKNQLPDELLKTIDFQEIYLKLLRYKHLKNYSNLYFTKNDLIIVLKSKNYSIFCKKELLTLYPFEELEKVYKIQDYVVQLLKAIIDKIYNYHKFRWYQKNLNYETISEDDTDYIPEEYVFIINASEQDLIMNIRKFVDQLKDFIREKSEFDGDIYSRNLSFSFEGNRIIDFFATNIHLFKPLIFKSSSEKLKFVKISPVNLVESERNFLVLLNDYIDNLQDNLPFDEIYLLRNPSRKGIGFFKTKNFYPDFILWIIKEDHQTINFIDPKGLMHIGRNNEKLKLYEDIKEIESEINAKTHLNITMNSYILSSTKFNDVFKNWNVPKKQLIEENILFLEDGETCISKLFGL